jgi:alpha-L-rhamnosidase
VLAENGRADVAFRLLNQTSRPSWLYLVEQGATTMWETWEGYDAKGNAQMSHNHYALGAVTQWLQEGLCGIMPVTPGYRHMRIKPVIGGGLAYALSEVEMPFGLAKSAWRACDSGLVRLEIEIPPGATAEVFLGKSGVENVGSGSWHWEYEQE